MSRERMIAIGGGLALLSVVLLWDHSRIKSAERRGGQQVIEKVRKTNDTATKLGSSAAAASGRPGANGVRSPRYRD